MAGTSFELYGDASGLLSALDKSNKAFTNLSSTAEQSGQGIDKVMNKLNKLASIAGMSFGVVGMTAFAKKVADVRGEFQQLEIAFGTMLGSTEKANKLMMQLANTAAKTPFDLQGIAQGAKQLIAYGTAAEEINSIIVSLGDIAAGLSLPLNDLVYLYGTTMVQGRMFTNDLKQLQGRGVPILEALSKQFGVSKENVSEMVSQGSVDAETFKKALLSLSQEGGKFAGLMEKQSKSITGQISNIQDGIDMMFNEIGQSSEGIINDALSLVSKLVENYKAVGEAIADVAITYGTYKAALIVTMALERAQRKAHMISILTNNAQISSLKVLTMTIWKQVAALKARAAAWLATPAGMITAVVGTICAASFMLNRQLEEEANRVEKINDAHNERISKIEEEKGQVEQLIDVLKSEESTIYDVMRAKDGLSKVELLKGVDIFSMTPEQIQETLSKKVEEQLKQAQQETINAYQNLITAYENKIRTTISSSMDVSSATESFIKKYQEQFLNTEEYLNKSQDEKKEFLEAERKRLVSEGKKYGKIEFTEEEKKIIKDGGVIYTGETRKRMPAELNQKIMQSNINRFYNGLYYKLIEEVDKSLDIIDESLTPKGTDIFKGMKLVDLVKGGDYQVGYDYDNEEQLWESSKGLVDLENKIKAEREYYAATGFIDSGEYLEKLEKQYDEQKKLYKTMTGYEWESQEKLDNELLNQQLEISDSRIKIYENEYSERYKLALQYKKDKEEIEREILDWEKQHPERELPSYFDEKKKVLLEQYTYNLKKLDKQINEFIDSVNKDTKGLIEDVEVDSLQNALKYSDSYNDSLILREALYEKELAIKNKEIEDEIKQGAESNFGKDVVEKYTKYKNGDTKGVSQEDKITFEQIDLFYKAWEEKRQAMLVQFEQQYTTEMLDKELQNFEEYANGIIQAEQDYQEELKNIREKYGLNADADVEKSKDANIKAEVDAAKAQRDRAKKSVEDKTGIVDNDLVERLNGLGEQIAGKTKQEIQVIYNQFIDEIDRQIEELKSKEMGIISGEQTKIDTAQTRMEEIDTELQGEGLSEEDKTALLQERATLEAQITTSMQLQAEASERLNGIQGQIAQLTTVKANAEKISTSATTNALDKQGKQIAKQQSRTRGYVESLKSVKDTADSIADAFGGTLSKGAKKALGAMSDVADFGMNTISSIESLTKGTMQGMEMSAFMASESISTVEKASVILTIISIVIQAVMAIAKIASQFTTAAQMQESIDKHLEQVDNLKRKNDELQRAYKSKTGIDYYKGMTAAAKDLNNVLREQQQALREANALYELQASKHGEDSDKAKEAKQQAEDIEDQYNETLDQQAEQLAEVANELGTTDLSSFSQSLAESIVEGFANGMEGIDDVFENSMQDLYRSMMTKQLALALEKQFEGVFNELNKRANDGDSLTRSDIDYLMTMMDQAEEGAQSIAQAYYDLFSERGLLEDADAEGSQGFGQMTQDQADTLTARFTALQIEGANMSAAIQQMAVIASEAATDLKLAATNTQALLYNSNISVQIAQEQLEQLEAIAGNTAMLAETNNRLKSIEQHTSKL